MRKNRIFILFCLILSVRVVAQNSSSGGTALKVNTITEKGAWCWFADPRAIHYKNAKGTINSTYIGYIDTDGNIKGTQINHLTNTSSEVLIRSYFQPDDHNNPTLLVLPDERVMVFYSRHTDEPCFYYRISSKKGDITTLGKEFKLETSHNTTYPSPFILSDDPDHIYLCWRGINWHPTIARLSVPDAEGNIKFNWGPFQMVRSKKGQGAGIRPYAKYVSNGKDKIYMAYTTTHPDNQSQNYIYFNYIDINTKELTDIQGTKLAVIGDGALHDVDATSAYKSSYPYAVVDETPARNWLWEVAADKGGKPVIATVSISEDKKSHDYYYVRWTGTGWQKTFLANAGGHFHQTPNIENCYSAGLAIDKRNSQVIYGSVPVAGKHGLVYELKKYTVGLDGTLGAVEQLTFDSPKNNVRPFMIDNENSDKSLVWMYGDYYDWIVSSTRPLGYPTGLRTSMTIPANRIDLKKGLFSQKTNWMMSSEKKQKVSVPKSDSFTIVLTLSLDSANYYGQILKFAGLSYQIPEDERPKPYLKAGERVYSSTNVLGNSDGWRKKPRGTGGQWYPPEKFNKFNLVISHEGKNLKTYINGLVDQFVEIAGLVISEVEIGGFKGTADHLKIYRRALSQDEIKALVNSNGN
ncbi:BNR-4 repeat-containing protein [Pedobacter sp. SYSU D00535]|uniref:BNR-4 repeat-containing protein n=1 Tax=Pedobacter sp. SYSU D00535 TaxID=2810308 RepID=UPI001A9743A1|nr:BNR-4 repeat-containing protein [Pedobacter sp. SYSU D00535]